MERHLSPKICAMFVLVFLVACASPTPSTPTPNAATQLAIDLAALPTPLPAGRISWRNQITSAALANNLIGDPATRNYIVYLPPGYDSTDKRYPVVFVLHGYPLRASAYVEWLTTHENALVAGGEAREMILVFPDAYDAFGGSWYLSSPTIGDYETYITRELVAEIDANFRTLPSRESRGITGCSVGGYGAIHLGLQHPDVFGVAAPMSAGYDWEHNPFWETAQARFTFEPQDFNDIDALNVSARLVVALAAAAAPNPGNPPFYLDMPFTLVDGSAQIAADVFDKVNALDPMNDLRRYLGQSIRLNGLLIFQDTDLGDTDGPEWAERYVQAGRDFHQALTENGVQHQYMEVQAGHCDFDPTPILRFMDDNLTF